MEIKDSPRLLSRKEIANYFQISERVLAVHLKKWEKEILNIHPEYSQRTLIPPVVFKFIYKKFTGEDFKHNWN